MKKLLGLPIILAALSALTVAFVSKPDKEPAKEASLKNASAVVTTAAFVHNHASEASKLSTTLYDSLRLATKGLSKEALRVAVQGYLSLKENGAVKNGGLLSIVDFSQSSRKKRFYLLDVKNNKLLENTYVAHGKNSGVDMATNFSNTIGSEKSSLGFYVTKGTYTGKNGFSLRMAGLDKGFNDNAEARAIVVHGADYVNAGRATSAYMGRSQGCPALPREDFVRVINLIKDGTTLFVYYPSEDYLKKSAVWNS